MPDKTTPFTPKEMARGLKSNSNSDNGATSKRMTQSERTALSDRRMLEAAVQMIGEQGTHNVNLSEIGIRAGYSRGLASSRFGSQEGLFFELLKKFNLTWKEESRSAVGERKGLDAFREANKALCDFFESKGEFIRVMYMIWYEMVGYSDAMRAELAVQHKAYRRGVAQWVTDAIELGEARADVSASHIALLYSSGVFGLIYQWLVDNDEIDIVKSLRNLGNDIFALIEVGSTR